MQHWFRERLLHERLEFLAAALRRSQQQAAPSLTELLFVSVMRITARASRLADRIAKLERWQQPTSRLA
jgi:hypothetical protein